MMPGIPAPHDERHPSLIRKPAVTRPHPTDAAVQAPKTRILSYDEMSDGNGSANDVGAIETRKILSTIVKYVRPRQLPKYVNTRSG